MAQNLSTATNGFIKRMTPYLVLAFISSLLVQAPGISQSPPQVQGPQFLVPVPPGYTSSPDPNINKLNQQWNQVPIPPGSPNPQPFSADVTRGRGPTSVQETLQAHLEINPGNYIFSTDNCYGLAAANGHFKIFALRGSLYSVEGKFVLNLARGRMLAITRDTGLRVNINNITARVLPNSAAIIETGPAGSDVVRVYALTANAAPHDCVQVFSGFGTNSRTISGLSTGQELVIANHKLSEQDLATTDEIARRQLGNSNVASDNRLYEFSLAQLADFDAMFACPRKQSVAVGYADPLLKGVYDRILREAAQQPEFPAQLADGKPGVSTEAAYEAVSDQEKAVLASKPSGESVRTIASDGNRLILAAANAQTEIENPDTVRLEKGTILVGSKRPVFIKADNKTVRISGGAIAMVKYNHGGLKVVNLSDLRKESVEVTTGPHIIYPDMGQEVLMSDSIPSLADVFDTYKVGHRLSMIRQVEGFGWVSTSQIAISDVLANQPLVITLRHNMENGLEKRMVGRIQKTAAVLAVVQKSNQPFIYGEPEDQTGATRRIADRCNHCMN